MTECIEIRPNPGPQTRAFSSTAKELLYGGAAGAGKSFFLVADPLRFIGHPKSRALLLRRTTKQLEDSLIAETENLYPYFGAKFNQQKLTWTFPEGAKVRLGHMEHESSKYNYDGAPYSYIGFDELTHFYRSQYTFMFSRLRSAYGVPTFMRATTNPGGIGHEWVLARFAPFLYPPGYAEYKGIRAQPGVKLYVRRGAKGDEFCARDWHDPDCATGECREGAPCDRHRPLSRTFIPGKLADNPFLASTDYETNLDALDPIERAQKKFGDWMIKPAAGKVFQRANIKILPIKPSADKVLARVRFWDRAATEGAGDWTAGVRMAVLEGGIFVVEDVVCEQLAPGGVMALIQNTANTDPPGTIIGLEQDPAQAGKFEAWVYVKALVGFNVKVLPTMGRDKLTRAGPLAAQSTQIAQNLVLLSGSWNDHYIKELNDFPDGENDDQVDASSGAFRLLAPVLNALAQKRGGVRVRVLGG